MKRALLLYVIFCTHLLAVLAQDRESNLFLCKNPTDTYVGAIIYPKSINEAKHQFLSPPAVSQITITATELSWGAATIQPSYESLMAYVKEGVAQRLPRNSVMLKYQFSWIDDSKALERPFGQNIPLQEYFSLPADAKFKRNTLMVHFSHEYVRVSCDMPLDVQYYSGMPPAQQEELLLVSEVGFGRKAVILVSSDAPQTDLKVAVQRALAGKKLSASEVFILSQAEIRYVLFGSQPSALEMEEQPLQTLGKHLRRPIEQSDFEVPLYFSACSLKGELYNNHF